MKTSIYLIFIGLMITFFGTTFETPATGEGFSLGIKISLAGAIIAGLGLLLNRLIASADN